MDPSLHTWPGDLSGRSLRPEIMDDPDLPEDRHVAALRGLRRINAVSRIDRQLLQKLLEW